MDEQDRLDLMQRDGLLVGIASFSLLSGMHFSQFFDPAFILVSVIVAPTFFISSKLLLFYFTSLFVALAALVVAGLPAALFERVTGRQTSDVKSLAIWLVGTMLIAAYALFP